MAAVARSSFFVSGGTLPLETPSYVVRACDDALFESLSEGRFCYVLNSRQMGKSSLSVRTMERLEGVGIRSIFIDLTKIGGRNVTPEQWYAGLLGEVGRALGLRQQMFDHWKDHDHLGPMQRFFGALREVALDAQPGNLVIFIDEIDATRGLSFSADEFFAGIRECYNRRVHDPGYSRLTFCLVGVAVPSDLIRDPRTTPFNIGDRIVLADFSLDEANAFAQGLGPDGQQLIKRVHHWTSGHPFLTQSLCVALSSRNGEASEELVDKLASEMFFAAKARETNINLADVGNRVLNGAPLDADVNLFRADALHCYEKVLAGKEPVADDDTNECTSVLKLAGLLRVDGGHLKVRNRIYERVFDRAWITENMPEQEVRRQKKAYLKGVLRTAGIAAAVILGVGGLAFSNYRLAKERAIALAEAKSENARANYELYVSKMGLIAGAWEHNNVDLVQDVLAETAASPARSWEWDYWDRLANNYLYQSDEELAIWPRFSPDGKQLASRFDDHITIADARTGRVIRKLSNVRRGVGICRWTHDGRLLDLVSGEDLQLLDPIAGKVIRTLIPKCDGFVVSNDAPLVQGGSGGGHGNNSQQMIVDLNGTRTLLGLPVLNAAFAPGGQRILLIGGSQNRPERQAILMEWPSKRILQQAPLSPGVRSASVSFDGRFAVVGDVDGTVTLMELQTLKRLWSKPIHHGFVRTVDFSADGKWLVSGGGDNVGHILDAKTGVILRTYRGCTDITISSKGDRVLCTYSRYRGYDPRAPDDQPVLSLSGAPIRGVVPRQDGTFLVQGLFGKKWFLDSDLKTVRPAPDGKGAAGDPNMILIANGSGSALYDLTTGKTVLELDSAYDVTFFTASADHRIVVVVDGARKMGAVYELTSRKRIASILAAGDDTTGQISPDGSILAVGKLDSTVTILNALTFTFMQTLRGHRLPVVAFRFSNDSRRLITCAQDDTARVWDLATGQSVLLKGHSETVNAAAFTPDGSRVATGSLDHSVRIWDSRTGRELARLEGHNAEVTSVAFDNQGKNLLSTSIDGTIRVWQTGKEK